MTQRYAAIGAMTTTGNPALSPPHTLSKKGKRCNTSS